jgi:hypothetical protein
MKNKSILFFLFLFVVPIVSFAGSISSGGGKGVVCRNPDGGINLAELLDLYEGQASGFVYTNSQMQYPVLADTLIGILGSGRDSSFQSELGQLSHDLLHGSLVLLPLGQHPVWTEDAGPLFPIPQSNPTNLCDIEQFATFTVKDGNNNVTVDQEIWLALDANNRAALVAHETLYKLFRDQGETNSLRARKAVAEALAVASDVNTSLPPVSSGLPDQRFKCRTTGAATGPSVFYAYYDRQLSEVVFQFDTLGNFVMLERSRIFLTVPWLLDINRELVVDSSFSTYVDYGLTVTFSTKFDSNNELHMYISVPDKFAATEFACSAF